jgi:hypothetical protein
VLAALLTCSYLDVFCAEVHAMPLAQLTAGGQLNQVNRTMQRTVLKLRKMDRMRGALASRQAESVRTAGQHTPPHRSTTRTWRSGNIATACARSRVHCASARRTRSFTSARGPSAPGTSTMIA